MGWRVGWLFVVKACILGLLFVRNCCCNVISGVTYYRIGFQIINHNGDWTECVKSAAGLKLESYNVKLTFLGSIAKKDEIISKKNIYMRSIAGGPDIERRQNEKYSAEQVRNFIIVSQCEL